MRAVVFESAGKVRVADVAEPVIEEPTDAILRVVRTSICGSDLHYVRGKTPFDPGGVLGHEVVGIVDSVGTGIARFAPGDRVVASFIISCGACWFCANGQSALCDEIRMLGGGPMLGSLPGAQAERVRIPLADVNLLPVPIGVEDERALFVGDALTTGYYAAALGQIHGGEVVAVVGAGPVGFFCAQAARALGAGRVLAIDPDRSRLTRAASTGAEPIDPSVRHPETAVAEASEGRGADVAIDAVGASAAFGSATALVRRGGTAVIVGVYAAETIELQLGLHWARAVTIRFAGLCPVHAWWRKAMTDVESGIVDPRAIVSHRVPMEDAPRGYELFGRHEAMKVVLLP